MSTCNVVGSVEPCFYLFFFNNFFSDHSQFLGITELSVLSRVGKQGRCSEFRAVREFSEVVVVGSLELLLIDSMFSGIQPAFLSWK